VPQFLRTVRQSRWFVHPAIPWLQPGELQGDAFLDLKTEDNTLSLFEVDHAANAERIAIAVAAGRERPDTVDYAVFDGGPLAGLGIRVQQTTGTTADVAINGLHYNLHQLTARQLVDLAALVSQGTIRRILGKRVKEMLNEGLMAERLDRARMKEELLRQL